MDQASSTVANMVLGETIYWRRQRFTRAF
jgi:hypothetical protein